MTYEKERNYEATINEYMNDHDLYSEMWTTHSNIDSALIISAQINWGDWKHDHGYYDYLMEEYAKANGFVIVGQDQEVTEENGSDCYSATHTHRMIKVQ